MSRVAREGNVQSVVVGGGRANENKKGTSLIASFSPVGDIGIRYLLFVWSRKMDMDMDMASEYDIHGNDSLVVNVSKCDVCQCWD